MTRCRPPETRPPRLLRLAALKPLLAGMLALAANGCDGNRAGAVSANSLVLEVEGSSEDLYGLELEVLVGGVELTRGPLQGAGRFVVESAPEGRVSVSLRDVRQRFAPVSTLLRSPGEHRLSLVAGTNFTLRVFDQHGAPRSAVRVVAWGGSRQPRAFDLEEGRAFGPLPPGRFGLVVSAPGCETRVLDLHVKQPRQPGRVVELPDLRLETGGATLRGRLVAVGRLQDVRALLRFGGVGQQIPTRPDGSFVLTGLPVGRGALKAALAVSAGDRHLLVRRLTIDADTDLGDIPLE